MKFFANNLSRPVKSLLVLFVFAGLVSCQKNKDDQPVPAEPGFTPEGYWQGHYRFTGSVTNYNFRVLIKPGGAARAYEMGIKTDTSEVTAKADGTWTYANGKLELAMMIDAPILFTGSINPDTRKWVGAWKKAGDVKGTFSLAR